MLSIGIVGLPNVGKSTLFNALTKKQAPAENYPFCTIDPNVGVVEVPDERLARLAEISRPKKIVPTAIEFVDIAGLVKGAHKGAGLGNQFLARIRETDAVCEVVRNFKDKNVVHVDGEVNPERDRETINLELIFADLATVEKRLAKVQKELKTGDKKTAELASLLERLKTALDAGQAARSLNLSNEEKFLIRDLNLISLKPIIYAINGEDGAPESGGWDGKTIKLNAKLEAEIAALPESEQGTFLKELGIKESGLDKLIKTSYELLDLITFLTTGPEETRAWTVKNGAEAPEAAGAIHTDFEKNFVRAEIINWEKLVEAGSETAAREKGWIRTEGRNYEIKDGDVCHFLIGK